MNTECLGKRLLLGAVAGFASTMVMQALLKVGQKAAPKATPPIRDDPGRFMVQKTKQVLPEKVRQKISPKLETTAAKSLGMGYGITFGVLYAALRPRGGGALRDGVALGLVNWAVGFLGWLPATGLMPPVWKHKRQQIAMPIAEHAIYGAATVAAYDLLLERF